MKLRLEFCKINLGWDVTDFREVERRRTSETADWTNDSPIDYHDNRAIVIRIDCQFDERLIDNASYFEAVRFAIVIWSTDFMQNIDNIGKDVNDCLSAISAKYNQNDHIRQNDKTLRWHDVFFNTNVILL